MERPPIAQKRPSIHKTLNSIESVDNYLNDITMETRSKSLARETHKSNDAPTASNDISLDSDEDIVHIEKSSSNNEGVARARKRQKKEDGPSSERRNESLNAKERPAKTDVANSSLKKDSKKAKEPTRLTEDSELCEAGSFFSTKVLSLIVLVPIVLFCAASYSGYGPSMNLPSWDLNRMESDTQNKDLMEEVRSKLSNMKSKYKNQAKDLWKEAYIGITSMIREPTKPSIILLLGHKSDPLDCLAFLFGNISSSALNSGRLSLTPSEFPADMGTVIEDLRSKIKEKKVVIIQDLLNINVEALKAFHNLCDRINPLVQEVILIMTIISDDYDGQSKPTQFVEEELRKKLRGKMKEDAIQPLITRITDGPILIVRPEPSITTCPLLTN